MLVEQYTSDAICRAVGLSSFIERTLPLPALRLVLMPSFDCEVCITLSSAAGDARLSVIALAESLWRQPAPCRVSAWKESVAISASAFVECLADFTAAVAADQETTGRMVCMDGMSLDSCLITEADVKRIVCHPYRPPVSRFVSNLIRLSWESCSGAGVRSGLAACARYVGVKYPREALPLFAERSRLVILGASEDRTDLLQQLGEHGEPV
jgi:hypothetical protein